MSRMVRMRTKRARRTDNEIAVLDTFRRCCRARAQSVSKLTVFLALRMRLLVSPTSRGTRRMTKRCKKEFSRLANGLKKPEKKKEKMRTRRNAVADACRATFVAIEAAGPGLASPNCKRLNEDLQNAFQFACMTFVSLLRHDDEIWFARPGSAAVTSAVLPRGCEKY